MGLMDRDYMNRIPEEREAEHKSKMSEEQKKKTGIDQIHPHLCRHTFATVYIIGGGSLEMLRLLRGYSGHLYISVQRKTPSPQLLCLQKQCFKCAFRGSNPGHPD